MGAYLHAQNTTTNRRDGHFMVKYHGKGKGKVYPPSDAYSTLHLCRVTWRATHPDQDGTFYFDDGLGYTPIIPGPGSCTREMEDLFTGLKFWRLWVFSRARFPSPPVKRGKGNSLPAGVHPSTLVIRSSGPSKRKRSSDSNAEDRDPKHTRGTRKETSSSRGSRVVHLVRSSPKRAPVPSPIPLVIPDNVIREHVFSFLLSSRYMLSSLVSLTNLSFLSMDLIGSGGLLFCQ
ncbi:hypothetical protein LIER_05968 [Lithospermum erythrorhizon]|uniref:Uncharacterized protein n=1 Tax=Lithospermum erythrorhizon TaxID=34254 RepID=A0AAV3P3T4_LITER